MTKKFFLLVFLFFSSVFFSSHSVILATSCSCKNEQIQCVPQTPSDCQSNEVCKCEAGEIEPNSGLILDCLPGICVTPTPTSKPALASPASGETQSIDFNAIVSPLPDLAAPFRPGPTGNVARIINLVLPYVFIAAGLILLFVLISAGFNMMFGAADEKKVAAAKAQLTNGIIGFVLLFLAYWIVQIVATILGIQVF